MRTILLLGMLLIAKSINSNMISLKGDFVLIIVIAAIVMDIYVEVSRHIYKSK